MATFTDTQKTSIRAYLGYANLDALGQNTLSVTSLNDRLNFDYSSSFISHVNQVLFDLASVDTEKRNSLSKTHLVKADVIEFNYGQKMKTLDQLGSQYVKDLASLIGVPILYNKYSGGGSKTSYRSA